MEQARVVPEGWVLIIPVVTPGASTFRLPEVEYLGDGTTGVRCPTSYGSTTTVDLTGPAAFSAHGLPAFQPEVQP